MSSLFKSEIKISENFGTDYIESLVTCIKNHFKVELIKENIVESELIFIEYEINGIKISFMTEGMIGTSLIGMKKDIETILTLLKNKYPEFLSENFDGSKLNIKQ